MLSEKELRDHFNMPLNEALKILRAPKLVAIMIPCFVAPWWPPESEVHRNTSCNVEIGMDWRRPRVDRLRAGRTGGQKVWHVHHRAQEALPEVRRDAVAAQVCPTTDSARQS